MQRKIYIQHKNILLAEYLPADIEADFNDWHDEETQKAYNFVMEDSFDEFAARKVRHRWIASVMVDEQVIGMVMLSPPGGEPDLAIKVYKEFRNRGYGTKAFKAALDYVTAMLDIQEVHAGCYPDNLRSMKMLEKCGFVPNPEGNANEKHYLTGEDIVQLDYIYRKPGQ